MTETPTIPPEPGQEQSSDASTPTTTPIRAMINHVRQRREDCKKDNIAYSFTDFLAESPNYNLDDYYDIKEIMQNQFHVLNAVFQYLMLADNPATLPDAFKAQRLVRETLRELDRMPAYATNPRINPRKSPPQDFTYDDSIFHKTLDD